MTMISDGVRTPDTIVDDSEPAVGDLLAFVEALRNLNAAMHRDWAKLNALLNATAQAWGWCSDYEARLRQYNNEFEVMALIDRRQPSGTLPDCFPVTIERLDNPDTLRGVATWRISVRRP